MNKKDMPKKRLDITKIDFSNSDEVIKSNMVPPRDGSAKTQLSGGNKHATNGKFIPLPISQKEIFAEFKELDPLICYVSDKNKRLQNLLSIENPEIKKLMSELHLGQRDEILVRMVNNIPEVIYGSRRLFCIKANNEAYISEGKKPVMIKALVADVPDDDISALADSENERV